MRVGNYTYGLQTTLFTRLVCLAWVLVGGFLFLCMCACSRKQFTYKHVCVRPAVGVTIVERSKDSVDSQGQKLQAGRIDLPIRTEIRGNGYTVEIYAPLVAQGLAFARARTVSGDGLEITGPDVAELDVAAGVRQTLGYRYQMRTSKSAQGIWDIAVSDGRTTLGVHQISYDVVDRGHKFETDTW